MKWPPSQHQEHAQNATYCQPNTFVALVLKTMCVTYAHSDVGYQKASLDAKNALRMHQNHHRSMPMAMAPLRVGLIAQRSLVQLSKYL